MNKQIKSFNIGSLKIDNPVICAPMAGVTCSPFRKMVRKHGASLTYTEMVSCEALVRDNVKTKVLMHIDKEDHPVAVQIFGSHPANMAEAAKEAVNAGADIVDINMGCPIPKVLRSGSGSALLLSQDLALEIAEKVVEAVDVPVTVKLRSDYRNNDNLGIELAQKMEKIGVAAISIHPRSCTQRFTGSADWQKITLLKEILNIPVIASGDIFDWEDLVNVIEETKADGVMIARGGMGNPWIYSQSIAALKGKPVPPPPSIVEKISTAIDLYKDIISFYGEKSGLNIGRKHMLWFLKGIPKTHKVKDEILKLKTPHEVIDELEKAKSELGD